MSGGLAFVPWPPAVLTTGQPRDGAAADSLGCWVRLGPAAAGDPAVRRRVLAHELTHVRQWWAMTGCMLAALALAAEALGAWAFVAAGGWLPLLVWAAGAHHILAAGWPPYLRAIETAAYRAQWRASGMHDPALLAQYARALAAQTSTKETEAMEAIRA